MSANNAFMSEEEEEAQLNQLGLSSSLFYRLVPRPMLPWHFPVPVYIRRGGEFVRQEGHHKECPEWNICLDVHPKPFNKMRTCFLIVGDLWYFAPESVIKEEPHEEDRQIYRVKTYLWRKPTWIRLSPDKDWWINSHDMIRAMLEDNAAVFDEEPGDVLGDLEAIERGDNSSDDDKDEERKTSVQTRSGRRPLKRNLSESHKEAVQEALNKSRKPRHS